MKDIVSPAIQPWLLTGQVHFASMDDDLGVCFG